MTYDPINHKLVVDPINRMEGHMGAVCTTAAEQGGGVRITNADLHGNLFRGFENILPGKWKSLAKENKKPKRTWGRDPKDAMIFTQRICGVCPIGHGTTSNQNIGNLLGFKVHNEDTGNTLPPNAAPLRNLLLGANHIMSHILHFYHLVALDYVNPVVTKPFLAPRYADSYYISGDRVHALAIAAGGITAACLATLETLPGWGETGQWANNALAINVYLVKQYLRALDMRRIAHEMLAIFGGKGPIAAGYTPGGVTATVDSSRINAYRGRLRQLRAFVGEPTDWANGFAGTMMFDTVAAAHLFPEYFWIGNAWNNYMAYGWGESNTDGTQPDGEPVALTGDLGAVLGSLSNSDNRLSNRGCIINNGPEGFTAGTYTDFAAGKDTPQGGLPGTGADRIVESIAHSRYNNYPTGDWRHPWMGITSPYPTAVTGANPKPDPETVGKYSWLKAPRFRTGAEGTECVCEVGPLSRMRVLGAYYPGILNDPDLHAVGALYPVCPRPGDLCPDPHYAAVTYNGDSILDRIAARTVETRVMCDMCEHELLRLEVGGSGATDPPAKANASGYGMSEASRGALGHWVQTDARGRIKLYQCVVPTTWNGGPRDVHGQAGPAESSLGGHGVNNPGVWIADPAQPIEVIRTTHSYDFCIACAVHIVKPDGDVVKVVVPPLP
jgi:hydrogenase large subunit